MFAMPIMDFKSTGFSKFWIYWAAAIPLTAIVMLVVFLLILPPESNPVVTLYRQFSPGYRRQTNSNVDIYGIKSPGSDAGPDDETEEFSVKEGLSPASVELGRAEDSVQQMDEVLQSQSPKKRSRWRIFGHSTAADEETGTTNGAKTKQG
jgi:hypothetical protein